MDVGSASIKAASGSLQEAVQVSTLKKAMNLEETQSAQLIETMKESAPQPAPSFGHKFSARA